MSGNSDDETPDTGLITLDTTSISKGGITSHRRSIRNVGNRLDYKKSMGM